MLIDTLNNLFASDGKLEQSIPPVSIWALCGELEQTAAPTTPTTSEQSPYDDPEVLVIARTFGPLVKGMTIEASLADMLTILPRQRRKSDSYKGLVSRLKVLGVELRVSSQYPSILNEPEKRKA